MLPKVAFDIICIKSILDFDYIQENLVFNNTK